MSRFVDTLHRQHFSRRDVAIGLPKRTYRTDRQPPSETNVSQPQPDHAHPRRPLLDIAGCANYIASSVRHVRRMVAERTLPHYKVGHYVRFDPDELDAWLKRNRRGPNDGLPAA